MALTAKDIMFCGAIAISTDLLLLDFALATPASFPSEITFDVSRTTAPSFLENYAGDVWAFTALNASGDALLSLKSVPATPGDPYDWAPLSVSMTWRARSWLGDDGHIQYADTPGGFYVTEFRLKYDEWRHWRVDLEHMQVLADVFINHQSSGGVDIRYSQIPVLTLSNPRLDSNLGRETFDASFTSLSASFFEFEGGHRFGTMTLTTVLVPEPDLAWQLASGLFVLLVSGLAKASSRAKIRPPPSWR